MIANFIAKKMLTTDKNDANELAKIYLTVAIAMIILSISWLF